MNKADLIKNIFFFGAVFFLTPGLLSTFLFLLVRPILHKFKFGQEVRSDGPQSHLTKQGTPTMGGIVFLMSIGAYMVVFLQDRALFALLIMIGFGLVGLLDDILKIKGKSSKGLNPNIKLVLQIILAGVFIYFNYYAFPYDKLILFPLIGGITLADYIFIPLMIFIIVGTNNAVNFTDGVDGLCSSVTIIISIFFAVVALVESNLDVFILCIVVCAVLSAFLIFNRHPASIFMGDVGSLFLGAYVALVASLLKIQLLIPLYGFVYFIEIISVMVQVSYFKITKGKRIFRMAPIHHHFELSGYSENKIVLLACLITLIGCVASFILFSI